MEALIVRPVLAFMRRGDRPPERARPVRIETGEEATVPLKIAGDRINVIGDPARIHETSVSDIETLGAPTARSQEVYSSAGSTGPRGDRYGVVGPRLL